MQNVLDKTFKHQLSEKQCKSSIKWAAINLCFLSVLYIDIFNIRKRENAAWIFFAEIAAFFILLLSFITNILSFIYHTFFTEKVVCDNESQRFLLNLNTNSAIKPAAKVQSPNNKHDDSITIRNLSYQAYSERKHTFN